MNIYNYPLQSQSFQWSNMWDFVSSLKFLLSLHPQWGENIKHVILPTWQPASHQMGDTCRKPDLWSQRNFKIGFAWSDVALLQALQKSPQPGLLPAPVQRCLPVCCEILIELLWHGRRTQRMRNFQESVRRSAFSYCYKTEDTGKLMSKRRGQGSNW